MAPPGRRRSLSPLSMIITLLFLFTSTASAVSAVLGIDLGTEYIKAALVKPGIPLEIVLTKDSKRKEASAVTFKPSGKGPVALGQFPERLYGGDALALTGRFPGDVYPNLKPLLGIPLQGSDVVEEYGARYPALELVATKERGTVGFKSGSFDKQEQPYSVEELLAMQLKNVRENAEAMAGKGSQIEDAVITIPAFYTADERRAVELAVELAGMNVLSLMSDGLAVGLNYATSRTFPTISEGGKPEYHVVYDMGAGSATATVLKMQGRSVKDVGRFNKTVQEVQVVGAGWDKALGGDSLNTLIMNDMIEGFVASPSAKSAGIQADAVKKHGRAVAKLWKEAERIRQVLSANQDTSASFESLYEDADFRYKMSRTKLEEMASAFIDNVETPIQQALVIAQLKLEDIDSVILHGGATRTPFVQKSLEKFAGSSKLRSNVNADEAAVFGAAFKGAGLSPSFRVKEIRDSEIATYPIKLRWTDEGKDRQQNLFIPTSQVGGPAKEVSFKNLDDFPFRMTQSVPSSEGPLVERTIAVVQSKNLTESVSTLTGKFGCTKEEISTKFRIRLSPVDGLPEVSRATVSCEVDDEKKANVVDGVKDFFGFGSKKGEQEPLNEEEEGPAEQLEATDLEASNESSSNGASSSTESAAKESSKIKTPKKRTESIDVAFTLEADGLPLPTKTELDRMNERLSAFASSDRSRRLHEEALNSLEGYTYRIRDILTDDNFVSASTESQRSAIEKLRSSTSEWLHDEGPSATLEVLRQKLKDLENLVKPVQSRKDEATKRPEQIKSLQDALNQTNTFIGAIRKQIDDASSAASSASESAASASASAASAASSSTPPLSDDLADLEEPDTSTTSEEPPQPTKFSDISPYTEEDLTSLASTYTSISQWLEENLAKQGKLKPHEDPVISTKDLEAKSRQLNQATMDLLQKKIRMPTKPKSTKKSSKSSRKTKTKGTATGSTEGAEASASSTDAGKPPFIRVGEGEDVPSEEEILEMVRGAEEAKERQKERVVDEL